MLRLLLLAPLALTACVDQGLDEDTTDEAALTGGPIAYEAGGMWFRNVGCPSPDPATCKTEGHFWIDLAIRNDAYDKRVGIVWTDTTREREGTPWHVATAIYEQPLGAPYERWGIDVTTGVFGGIEPKPRIRFAAFVEMAGTTSWDNNGGADYIVP